LRHALLVCGLSAVPAFATALDWPEFRGPDAEGHSAATNVPIHWNAKTNIAWTVPLAAGWSSPVIADGKIYLTTAHSAANGSASLHAVALDAESGRTLWDTEIFQPSASETKKIHSKNSLASPTPIVRDGRIYVHFGHMGTAALDLSGKVLWKENSLKYLPLHGNGGSPELVGDLLIFSCDGTENPYLAALDAKTGSVKWKTPRNTPARAKFSFSTPLLITVDGRQELVSPASGFVGAYEPQSGRELWRVRYGEGYSVVPRPVFAHGLLFLSSGFDRPILYAINPKGAVGDATASHVAWTVSKGAPTTPSPLALGNEVYIVSDGGVASCLDAKTGKIVWNERLGGGFSASPVSAENRIYFQNESGVGFVVAAGTNYQLVATNDLGERSLASPAIIDNAIFIRTESHLWRIQENGPK
jgi:outer membrane protein assembly factor BamB